MRPLLAKYERDNVENLVEIRVHQLDTLLKELVVGFLDQVKRENLGESELDDWAHNRAPGTSEDDRELEANLEAFGQNQRKVTELAHRNAQVFLIGACLQKGLSFLEALGQLLDELQPD
jgi:hypothetical protein